MLLTQYYSHLTDARVIDREERSGHLSSGFSHSVRLIYASFDRTGNVVTVLIVTYDLYANGDRGSFRLVFNTENLYASANSHFK